MGEEKSSGAEAEIKKRRSCLGRLFRLGLVGIVLLAGFIAWLNGPGIRWLGPKVAKHFLEKADFEGDLRIGGTLLGGLNIYDLDLRSEGSVERLVIDRLKTDYRFSEIIRGELRSFNGEGVHLDLRLIEKEEEEDKEPVDFAALGKTLNKIRELIVPVDVNLQRVSVSVKKDDELVVGIGDTSLTHESGSDQIGLDLGTVTDMTGRTLEPQNAKIFWEESELKLNNLELLPVLGVRELLVQIPEDGNVAASGRVRLGDSVLTLDLGEGIQDVRIDLVEGEVDFQTIAEGLGVKLPVSGKLTSLALELRKFYPDWQLAVGSGELFLETIDYDGWGGSELALGLALNDGDIGAKITGQSLGSAFSIEGDAEFKRERLEEEGPVIEAVSGSLRINEVDKVLGALDQRFELEGRFEEFPGSEISGDWSLDFQGGQFAGVSVQLLAEATEVEASPIRLDASYAGKVVTVRSLETENQKLSAKFDTATQDYEFEESLSEFSIESIMPWLEGAGVELPGTGTFSLEGKGSGNLLAKEHRGSLDELAGIWKWKEVEGEETPPPISLAGAIDYNWPETVKVSGLTIEAEGQKIELTAELKDEFLELQEIVWSEGDEKIATGDGKIPVPSDFSDLKGFLADDDRAIDLHLTTETLPLAKLRPWVKGLDQIGEGATGKVKIDLGGSLAEPQLDASVELLNINVPNQPSVPPADITLKATAKDGVAKISGQIVAPDYGPATLDAELPFLPKKWAEDPESLKGAPIKGVLNLPKIDLSRFKGLIPGAKELKGQAEGNIVLGGTVGEPDVQGQLNLKGGNLEFSSLGIPVIDGVSLDIKSTLQTLEITGGVENLEGGYLDLKGSMNLREAEGKKVGDLDLKLTARGLPVVRNDSMIVRANADISVKGGIADAAVTGEVGIIDSLFYKDIVLIPIGKPFLEPAPAKLPGVSAPQKVKGLVPEPFGSWSANVVVKTVDPVLIRGNLGEGEVDVSLRIQGKLADPKPTGTVRLRNGTAALPFTTVEVSEGTLSFSPQTGLDPVVELRATAEPRPYRVQIYAYGRISDPKLVLTSQPPLPENEIMTLLATGTTTSGLEDSQAATSRATQLLLEELRRGRFPFGKQLRPILGLFDDVDFSLAEADPYASNTFNSATLRLSSKWFITAGISEEGNQRVMAIYRLRFR